MSEEIKCRCGCGGEAKYLCDGTDFDGSTFTDEPACQSATAYMEESAHELGLTFTKRAIQPKGAA